MNNGQLFCDPSAISLLIPAAADAGGLLPEFHAVLRSFDNSDRNNTVIRTALADLDVDWVEMPYGLQRENFNCTRDRRPFGLRRKNV